jgi:hypothetical protein
MPAQKYTKNKIDYQTQTGEYWFRFCNFFDNKSREFEDKIHNSTEQTYSVLDSSGISRDISWPQLPFWQSYHYFDHLDPDSKPFYLLQMSNLENNFHYQIVIQVEVSKMSLFRIGIVPKWIMNTQNKSTKDQDVLIGELICFCRHYTKLMSLRIRPYMPGNELVDKTYDRLSAHGFHEVSASAYTQTRVIDLRPSVKEILDTFSANGRARLKIKNKDTDKIEINKISNTATIPFLKKALNDSFLRSVNRITDFDFEPLFASMDQLGSNVVMFGFYLKKSLLEPQAFITGIQHGSVVEFSVGGSLSSAHLRQFPFNHLLMWRLLLHSKENGIKFLDLGGITSGEADDALSGISNFKRYFPGFEMPVGREMLFVLRPIYLSVYTGIKKVSDLIKIISLKSTR